MPACRNEACGKVQSKLNDGDLCRICFDQRKSQATIEREKLICGFTEQQIAAIPDLPDNWINATFNDLTGGHLLKIIMMASTSTNQRIDRLTNRIDELERSLNTNIAIIEKHKDEINENSTRIAEAEKDIGMLKKTILNQQSFIEQTQRNSMIKNLMISGIPNVDMKIDNINCTDANQKVLGILSKIDDTITERDYQLQIFEPAEGKVTHSVKVIMNDVNKKKAIMNETKKLKDIAGFKDIYIKNDETKLARNENTR